MWIPEAIAGLLLILKQSLCIYRCCVRLETAFSYEGGFAQGRRQGRGKLLDASGALVRTYKDPPAACEFLK